MDAEASHFHSQTIREPLLCMLGRRIPSHAGGADVSCDGRGDGDSARLLLSHVWQRGRDRSSIAQRIHVELVSDVFGVLQLHRTQEAEPGIGEEHVDGTVVLDDGIHDVSNASLVTSQGITTAPASARSFIR
jgi:hypothetical protein